MQTHRILLCNAGKALGQRAGERGARLLGSALQELVLSRGGIFLAPGPRAENNRCASLCLDESNLLCHRIALSRIVRQPRAKVHGHPLQAVVGRIVLQHLHHRLRPGPTPVRPAQVVCLGKTFRQAVPNGHGPGRGRSRNPQRDVHGRLGRGGRCSSAGRGLPATALSKRLRRHLLQIPLSLPRQLVEVRPASNPLVHVARAPVVRRSNVHPVATILGIKRTEQVPPNTGNLVRRIALGRRHAIARVTLRCRHHLHLPLRTFRGGQEVALAVKPLTTGFGLLDALDKRLEIVLGHGPWSSVKEMSRLYDRP